MSGRNGGVSAGLKSTNGLVVSAGGGISGRGDGGGSQPLRRSCQPRRGTGRPGPVPGQSPRALRERVEERHQGQSDLGHPGEVNRPLPILGHDEPDGPLGVIHAGGLEFRALLGRAGRSPGRSRLPARRSGPCPDKSLLCSVVGVRLAGMEVSIFTQIGFVVRVGLGACPRIKSIGNKNLRHFLIWQTVVFPENSKIDESAIRRKSLSGFT